MCLNSKLALVRLEMLFCIVKMTWKSIKPVEMVITIGISLDTPPHPESVKEDLPNITGDIFQTTTNQLMKHMLSLKPVQLQVQGQ